MQKNLPQILRKLVEEQRVLCPKSSTPLVWAGDCLKSEQAAWQIKNRSVDLYGDYEPISTDFTDHSFAREVAAALHLGGDQLPNVIAAVADTTLLASDPAYTAEIAELADRLGITRENVAPPPVPVVDNQEATLSLITAFIGKTLPVNACIKRSIRVRNDGVNAVSSHGSPPVYISYHWLDTANKPIIFDGVRSPLPIPLAAGSAITVICDIFTPPTPGEYHLQFQAVVEGVRWMKEAVLTAAVAIEGKETECPEFEYTTNNYSYSEDHTLSLYMIGDMLNATPGQKRILEVGGGIHPQSNALTKSNCEVISIDISSPMSQLGQLYFDHVNKNDQIAFVTCDAHAPPFQAETFNCIMIFSALHHFADPVRLLTNLKAVLKNDGFIAVMCEPCEPHRDDPMYIRDLEKGINEQIWTVEEYIEIFDRSGLKINRGRIDGGSLKAILVKK